MPNKVDGDLKLLMNGNVGGVVADHFSVINVDAADSATIGTDASMEREANDVVMDLLPAPSMNRMHRSPSPSRANLSLKLDKNNHNSSQGELKKARKHSFDKGNVNENGNGNTDSPPDGDENARPIHENSMHTNRRMSSVDISRSAHQRLLKLSAMQISPESPQGEQTFCGSEMERFKQKVLTAHATRRSSLADLIPDWPKLETIEKFKLPEEKELDQYLLQIKDQFYDLRRADPNDVFKMDYWVSELEDQKCSEKEKVTLSCRYSKANIKYRWFKGNIELFHGHKYNVLNEDGLLMLVVQRVSKEDEGVYTCQADDKHTSAKLSVEEKKIKYHFTTKLADHVTVRQFKPLVLECFVNDSHAVVHWTRNDQIIEYVHDVHEISHRDEKCALRIRSVTKDDHHATYACVIYDDVTKCKISVAEPEFEFTKHLTDLDALEKEQTCFECETNFENAPVEWKKDDKPLILYGTKYKVHSEGRVHQLHIDNIEAKDSTFYSCSVQDKKTKAKLFVSPEVVILEHMQTQVKLEKESATFSVRVRNPKRHKSEWYRDGINLSKMHEHMSGGKYKQITEADGELEVLEVSSLQLGDAGMYKCRIADRETECQLVVKKCQLPPRVIREHMPDNIVARAGKELHLEIPFQGTPAPATSWTKNGNELKSDSGLDLYMKGEMCHLRIGQAKRSHTGLYVLRLANESGVDSISFNINILSKPSEPEGPLNVVEVFKDRCHLRWEPPKDDGGSEIKHYAVELNDSESREWVEAGIAKHDTQMLVSLVPGRKYRFRVKAVNSEGESQPLGTEKEILAKDPWDPPSKPLNVRVVDYDHDRVELKWDNCESNGGSPILKYVVEMKHYTHSWQTVGMAPFGDRCAIISGLVECEIYEFRVVAVNEAGKGEYSDPTDALKLKRTRVAAKIDHTSYNANVQILAGENLVLCLKFDGTPIPKIRWSYNKPFNLNDDFVISTDHCQTQLVCNSACRSHSAVYKLQAVNKYGSDEAVITVNIQDVPGPPAGPLNWENVSRTEVNLSWSPPLDDGGKELQYYRLEKRFYSEDAPSARNQRWDVVSDYIPALTTSYTVGKLVEGGQYQFRVAAGNGIGVGEFLTTEGGVVVKNPFAPPPAPSQPSVEDFHPHWIKVRWAPTFTPLTDNSGKKVSGYHVERTDARSINWSVVNKQIIQDQEFLDCDCRPGVPYIYRIIAENAGGQSSPSEPSQQITMSPLQELPQIDRSKVSDMSFQCGQTVRLFIAYTGCPPPTVQWFKGPNMILDEHFAHVKNMNGISELFIRSIGMQHDGEFKMLVFNDVGKDEVTFNVSVLGVPDPPEGPINILEKSVECVVLEWSPPKKNGGKPIERYIVRKRVQGTKDWTTVLSSIKPTKTQATLRNLDEGQSVEISVHAANEVGEGEGLRTVVVTDESNDYANRNRRKSITPEKFEIYNQIRRDRRVSIATTGLSKIDSMRQHSIDIAKPIETHAPIKRANSQTITEVQKTSPPKFTFLLRDRVIREGDNVKLMACFTGVPAPQISWYKDGELLSRDGHFDIYSSTGVCSLEIGFCHATDSGRYVCKAANAHGKDETRCQLDVYEKSSSNTTGSSRSKDGSISAYKSRRRYSSAATTSRW